MAVGIIVKKISTIYFVRVLKISIFVVLHCETTSSETFELIRTSKYCFKVSILDVHSIPLEACFVSDPEKL